jgi:hypothetical protein
MMQMQPIARLGSKQRDRSTLMDGVSATDLAIGQLLGMAQSADFHFQVLDGRLTVVAAKGDWKTMKAIGRVLSEIGIDTIVDYFQRHPSEERELLSKPASFRSQDY